jgi:hypothetical protein
MMELLQFIATRPWLGVKTRPANLLGQADQPLKMRPAYIMHRASFHSPAVPATIWRTFGMGSAGALLSQQVVSAKPATPFAAVAGDLQEGHTRSNLTEGDDTGRVADCLGQGHCVRQ